MRKMGINPKSKGVQGTASQQKRASQAVQAVYANKEPALAMATGSTHQRVQSHNKAGAP